MQQSKANEQTKMNNLAWGNIILNCTNVGTTFNPRFQANSYIGATADEMIPMGFGSRAFNLSLIWDNSVRKSFPGDFQKFLLAYKIQLPLPFDHPIEGRIICVAKDFNYSLTPDHVSGCTGTVTMVETLTETATVDVVLSPSKVVAFEDYTIIGMMNFPSDETKTSFMDMLNDISTMQNQISGLGDKYSGMIDQTIAKAEHACNSAIGMAKTLGTAEGAIVCSLLRKKLEVFQNAKPTAPKIYTVPNRMSLFELVSKLNTSMPKLIEKNPGLGSEPVVKKGTIVFIP